MTAEEERQLKERFLARNPYAENGIAAPLRRNRLYVNGVTTRKKQEIHCFWQDQLNQISLKYRNPQSVMTYLADVFRLRQAMNERYTHSFCGTGFRISHAQKSLSVVLKYKWCCGEIPAPPLCPIDRNVLAALNIPGVRWTKMNEADLLRVAERICARAEAENLSAAQWELMTFENL